MRSTNEQRELVLELRRRHSLSEVAEITGLPLGTVKSIISRSGLFADNPRHRAMFTLPPRQSSRETLPAVSELLPQLVMTGGKGIDALLWLRQVIETGDRHLWILSFVVAPTNLIVIGDEHCIANQARLLSHQVLLILCY